jgi:hypothetical protein
MLLGGVCRAASQSVAVGRIRLRSKASAGQGSFSVWEPGNAKHGTHGTDMNHTSRQRPGRKCVLDVRELLRDPPSSRRRDCGATSGSRSGVAGSASSKFNATVVEFRLPHSYIALV